MGSKILIIDDDANMLDLLETLLLMEGFEVAHVGSQAKLSERFMQISKIFSQI